MSEPSDTFARSNAAAMAAQPLPVVTETILRLQSELAATEVARDQYADLFKHWFGVAETREGDVAQLEHALAVAFGNREEVDNLLCAERERADALYVALEGVLNSAAHPDIALRAVLVNLAPVRAALERYKRS